MEKQKQKKLTVVFNVHLEAFENTRQREYLQEKKKINYTI